MDKFNILIVDDNNQNRQVIAAILDEIYEYTLTLAADGETALEYIRTQKPDLILLDIMMPGIDGYSVANKLKEDEGTAGIPIFFITAISDVPGIVKAFDAGAIDYITKPFKKQELLVRVRAQAERKKLMNELEKKNKLLENKKLLLTNLVEEKIKEIEEMTIALITSLENANLLNDTDTGAHIKRVSEYSKTIAIERTNDVFFVKNIKLFSSLHDVGKVGIPDRLLKKPEMYTPAEYEEMKKHVLLGASMLSSPVIPEMAKNIALYHHEKWDGTGYIHKLKGTAIPLEARIVALADVYDALGTERVYKPAFSEEEIDRIIQEEKGHHFDPELVDIYFHNKPAFCSIKKQFG